ncbi:hypothetical protein O9929_16190 [Vibrio lentus]|nr:hypothetical protein [Vibrio lentus]
MQYFGYGESLIDYDYHNQHWCRHLVD